MNGPSHNPQRAYWLKTLHQWHWISSAIALIGILLFSFTGITLNHVAQLDAEPRIINRSAQLPAELRTQLHALGTRYEQDNVIPAIPGKLIQWWTHLLA